MRYISIKDGEKSVIEISNIKQFKRPCLFIGNELSLRKVATFSSEEDSILFENFLWENFLKQNEKEEKNE